MSFLGKLFGGGGVKNDSKAATPAEAIQRLRGIEDILLKKQEYLERNVEQELETAKKNGTKNKRVAIQALKKKKRFEKQLLQLDGTLSTIEYQREALENASTNTEVLKIMGFAAKALRNAHEMGVDDVHKLMDDIQEEQELAEEITLAISTPMNRDSLDEDELMRELEELEQEQLNEKFLDLDRPVTELPSVPVAEPSRRPASKRVEEEDEDMKELAAWAS